MKIEREMIINVTQLQQYRQVKCDTDVDVDVCNSNAPLWRGKVLYRYIKRRNELPLHSGLSFKTEQWGRGNSSLIYSLFFIILLLILCSLMHSVCNMTLPCNYLPIHP